MTPIEIACRTCLAQSGEICDPKLSVVNAEGFHNERFWDALACSEPDSSTPTREEIHQALLNSDRF